VIVTTPQDIALLDARKGIEMFRKVDIPVLGIVENMSTHICPNCGAESPLFGSGGGARIAETYGALLLGQLPLAIEIREQADGGTPAVVADPDGQVRFPEAPALRPEDPAAVQQRVRRRSVRFPQPEADRVAAPPPLRCPATTVLAPFKTVTPCRSFARSSSYSRRRTSAGHTAA